MGGGVEGISLGRLFASVGHLDGDFVGWGDEEEEIAWWFIVEGCG
jgi:hypothetical protein